MSSCINEDNYNEVNGPLAKNINWFHKWDANLTKEEFLQHKCNKMVDDKLLQVAPVLLSGPKPIIYHVCEATNYCAAKRQATAVPEPDEIMLSEFNKWFEKKMKPEIANLLYGFIPDFENWFNHLNYKQQKPIKEIHQIVSTTDFSKRAIQDALYQHGIDTNTNYTMFVKSEKQ